MEIPDVSTVDGSFSSQIIRFPVAGAPSHSTARQPTGKSLRVVISPALIALPFTAMAGRAVVDPDWAGTVLAAILTFFVVYFGLRLAGSLLSKSAKAHPSLGGLDRLRDYERAMAAGTLDEARVVATADYTADFTPPKHLVAPGFLLDEGEGATVASVNSLVVQSPK